MVGSATAPRRYHGYLVKLYYNDHLQDVMAKPAQLASLRPEPGERAIENFIDAPPPRTPSRKSPPQETPGPLDDSLVPLPQ